MRQDPEVRCGGADRTRRARPARGLLWVLFGCAFGLPGPSIGAGPIEIREAGDIRVKTHNGRIKIGNANGDVHAVTHNGRIGIDSSGGKLYAETHNGRVNVAYAGGDVTLITHNGEVVADLQECTAIDGDVTTYNGSIEIVVGERTSADLQCETYNGRIKYDVPLSNTEITRRRLSGTIGAGDGRLGVTTHNGGIRVKKGAG